MTLKDLTEKWKKLCADMNAKGIPIPMIRDPKTHVGSGTFTLMMTSALIVILGILGRTANYFQGINVADALQFFVYCAGLYLGRKITTKEGGGVGGSATPDKDADSDK